jgi:hypothetical protein
MDAAPCYKRRMRTPRYILATVALATACSAPAANTTAPATVPGHDAGGGPDSRAHSLVVEDQGGSRLELKKWTTTDGIDAGHSFYDRVRKLACLWYAVGDNAYRCLPSDNVFYYPVRFEDSLCTRPVYEFIGGACRQPPAFIRDESGTLTCPTSFLLRKMGTKLPNRSYYSRASTGECVSRPIPDRDDLYEFGDPVPLTDFVAGTIRVGPVVKSFAQRTVVGEDGSRAIFGFRDVAGQLDCSTRTAADGSFRCLPFTVGTMTAFVDDACTMPAGLGAKSACTTAGSYLSRSTAVGCEFRASIYRAGERLEVGYENFSNGCDTSTGAPFSDYWRAGDEVAPETFVAATLTPAAGPARLQPRIIGTPMGPVLTQSLWDTKLDRACSTVLMSDDTYRCAGSPLPRIITGFFADSECTQPVLEDVADPQGGVCESGYYYQADATECPVRWHIFNVDEKPYTGTVYHMDVTGCVSMTRRPPDTLHLLGAEVMPGELAEIKPPTPDAAP